MESQLKRKVSVLIHLAGIDGHFDIKEKAFIYNVCLRNGIVLDDIGDLIDNPDPIGSLHDLSYDDKKDYLQACLQLMLVDGKVLPREVIFCIDIGERLGFQKKAVEEMVGQIDSTKKYTEEEINKMVEGLPLHTYL